MAKITFIGGGSAKFVAGLVRDLFTFPELAESRICLMDVDAERMDRSRRLVEKIIADLKLPATVQATTDQREAIDGSDFIFITIMVGGFKHYESDGTIPIKYGVLPTVGDTIGPGAVFRLVRTGPVLMEIARNATQTAPEAWIFNYSNPMAMNTWLLLTGGCERTVGLCHSIQGAYKQIARWLHLPPEEFRYTAGGINHINFYLTLTHNGRDVYPMLLAEKERILRDEPHMRVKFELLEHIGYWPAEGEHHQCEYYPWFRKDEAAARHYATETMWGYQHDVKVNRELQQIVDDQIAGRRPIRYEPSEEYGAWMVHSVRTGAPRLIYGNVRNRGLIENLPPESVVEVPCHVDANGVTPCRVGRIPTQLAAVMTPHIHIHELTVGAVLTRDRRKLRQAIQLDPLTAAVLTLPQIQQMTNDLLAANQDYLTDWPGE